MPVLGVAVVVLRAFAAENDQCEVQARPELLLDYVPGLLPALLRVIELGLGDGDDEAAAAAAAAADEAEERNEAERAAKAAGWPFNAGRKRAREPLGAPKVRASSLRKGRWPQLVGLRSAFRAFFFYFVYLKSSVCAFKVLC